jgi:radical SAM protein with 4Fe4S-binding SPASM domain
MIRSFYPMLTHIPKPDTLTLKIDCSFIPALLYHRPPLDELDRCAVSGCLGGDQLLAVDNAGFVSGCSFVRNSADESVLELRDLWHSSRHLGGFRALPSTAAEPCRSCAYLGICRCGCRAVSLHHTGSFSAPDPECPFVFDYDLGHRSHAPDLAAGGNP